MINYHFEFNALQLVETHPIIGKIWRVTLIILFFFILLLFLPWRQNVVAEGTLIAYDPSERMQFISAPINGFIEHFYVSEDEHVQKGMKLFDMVDPDKAYKQRVYRMKNDFEQQTQNTQKESAVLKQNQESLLAQKEIRTELYDKRYMQAKEQLKSLQLNYQAQKKNYEITNNQFNRVKTLYAQKIESRKAFERTENTYIAAKTQLDKTQIDIEVQKRQLTIIKQEKEQFLEEIDNQIRTMQNSILSVETRLNIVKREYENLLCTIARYETSSLVSEKNGSVMRIVQRDKNTYIKQGEPIIHFVPDVTQRAILLKVSDFNMPLIKEGLTTRIRFHGWPVLNISGWPAIQFGTYGGIIKKLDPIAHEKGFYYAYVMQDPDEPWPTSEILRVGTTTTIWIALARVPIWYEIWRLMNGFPSNMVTPEKK